MRDLFIVTRSLPIEYQSPPRIADDVMRSFFQYLLASQTCNIGNEHVEDVQCISKIACFKYTYKGN